ncbi:hypothetical protein EV421DRAFT_290621 [Armillaria borealis]|uniref:F-box domain-containing protein n=1 Tax=Armillaria borealis TaxID=47425 RepID=A0AA39MSS9_9AGAR|nr:hypothetical protein EV421DRAFT_290621 [Armillaria borealis]
MSFLRPENPPPEALIPILRGNVALSDEGISQIQDTIFASDQAISHLFALLTGQCSQLNERHKSLTQYVSQCRSLFAPIRRLPRDVLESIFAYVPRSAKNSLDICSAPWHLAHICYTWRDIVFTTPLLWANIDICPPYSRGEGPMLGRHLQLSEECPLDISFSFPKFVESEDIEIFSLILQHSTHWKRMQITFLYDVYTVMRNLSTVAGKLPLLEEIIFLGTRRIGSIYTEMLVTAPSLRRAWLPSFNGVHGITLNATLTHFAGTVTYLKDIQHVMGLPALIECQLTLPDNGLSTRCPPLRNNHIQRFSTTTPDILAKLTLPSLVELRLACKCRNRDSLIAFLVRSSCSLTSLHITHLGIGDALVLSEYQEKLERLTIDAGWNDIGIIDSYPNLHQLTIRQTESYKGPHQDEIKEIITHLQNRLGKEGKGRRVTSLQISCLVRLIDSGFDYVKALRMNGLDVLEGEGLQVVVYREARTWLNSKLSAHELC